MRWLALVLGLLVANVAYSQTFTLATFNCENAFDTIHDEGKNDYEFLPDGIRHWNRSRMFKKLKNIGKVILSIDSLRPADVVCLNEVENDTVLTYLTKNTPLVRMGYEYVMTNSLDERGIDIALVYSPYTFHLIGYETIRPKIEDKTRDVLHATGWVSSGDTLDIFAVHLPSKLNGKRSEQNRIAIVSQIMECIDSLQDVRENLYVAVMGDMNDGPDSKAVRHGFKGLHNLFTTNDKSYKYQGNWDCIDQILVNERLKKKAMVSGVAERGFMLEPDEKFSGMKPKRTFIGWKYNDGFSDHLPVFAKFVF